MITELTMLPFLAAAAVTAMLLLALVRDTNGRYRAQVRLSDSAATERDTLE